MLSNRKFIIFRISMHLCISIYVYNLHRSMSFKLYPERNDGVRPLMTSRHGFVDFSRIATLRNIALLNNIERLGVILCNNTSHKFLRKHTALFFHVEYSRIFSSLLKNLHTRFIYELMCIFWTCSIDYSPFFCAYFKRFSTIER